MILFRHLLRSHDANRDGALPPSAGGVQAVVGPVEAQERGSLHPHMLMWLVGGTIPPWLVALLADEDGAAEDKDLQSGYDKEVRPWLELAEDLRALSLDKEL